MLKDSSPAVLSFVSGHMREGLKEIAVKGQFEQTREFLLEVLPGSIDTVEMLALLEGAEVLAIESVKNNVEDGL